MSQLFFSESIKYSVTNAYSQTNDSYEQVLVGESKKCNTTSGYSRRNIYEPVLFSDLY